MRGLTQEIVASEEEALAQVFAGEQARSTAPHALNTLSSRSHTLFSVAIEMRTSEDAAERAVVSARGGGDGLRGRLAGRAAARVACCIAGVRGARRSASAAPPLLQTAPLAACFGTPTTSGSFSLQVSKLTLVDLAGSERIKKTNASGAAMREAACINKSLSFLEQVVNALVRRDAHVPFR